MLSYQQKTNRIYSENLALLRHAVDLLSTKDPMTYQVVATADTGLLESDYDPSNEAEIERLKKRGYGDGSIYDEASGFPGDLDPSEFERIRSELGGSYS
jgi:hypothetical protein